MAQTAYSRTHGFPMQITDIMLQSAKARERLSVAKDAQSQSTRELKTILQREQNVSAVHGKSVDARVEDLKRHLYGGPSQEARRDMANRLARETTHVITNLTIDLAHNLQETKANFSELQDRHDQAVQQLADQHNKDQAAEERIQKLERSRNQAVQQLGEERLLKTTAEEQLENLRQQNDAVVDQLEEERRQKEATNEQLKNVQNLEHTAVQQLEETRHKAQDLDTQLQMLKRQKETAVQQLEEERSQSEHEAARLTQIQSEKDTAVKLRDEALRDNAAAQQRISDLDSVNKEAENRLGQIHEEQASLQQRLRELESSEQEAAQQARTRKDTLDFTKRQFADLRQDLDDANSVRTHLEQHLKSVTKDRDQRLQSVHDLQEEADNLRETTDNLEEKVEEIKELLIVSHLENMSVRRSEADAVQQLQQHDDTIGRLRNQLHHEEIQHEEKANLAANFYAYASELHSENVTLGHDLQELIRSSQQSKLTLDRDLQTLRRQLQKSKQRTVRQANCLRRSKRRNRIIANAYSSSRVELASRRHDIHELSTNAVMFVHLAKVSIESNAMLVIRGRQEIQSRLQAEEQARLTGDELASLRGRQDETMAQLKSASSQLAAANCELGNISAAFAGLLEPDDKSVLAHTSLLHGDTLIGKVNWLVTLVQQFADAFVTIEDDLCEQPALCNVSDLASTARWSAVLIDLPSIVSAIATDSRHLISVKQHVRTAMSDFKWSADDIELPDPDSVTSMFDYFYRFCGACAQVNIQEGEKLRATQEQLDGLKKERDGLLVTKKRLDTQLASRRSEEKVARGAKVRNAEQRLQAALSDAQAARVDTSNAVQEKDALLAQLNDCWNTKEKYKEAYQTAAASSAALKLQVTDLQNGRL